MSNSLQMLPEFLDYLSISTPVNLLEDITQGASTFQEPAIMNLIQNCRNNSTIIDDILVGIATHFEQDFDLYKKGMATMICGILVEYGGNPRLIVDTIIHQLEKHLAGVERYVSYAEQIGKKPQQLTAEDYHPLFVTDPDAVKAWFTINYVVLPAMTTICRVKEARQQARTNHTLIKQVTLLEDKVDNLHYFKQVLHSVDDLEMIILHPESQTGMRIRASMVQNNFHFFTLLQDVYLQTFADHSSFSSFIRNEEAINVAKGRGVPEEYESMTDKAWFGFYDYHALSEQGKLVDFIPPAHWLFGEGTLYHVPTIDGVSIVLLGKNMFGERLWGIDCCIPVHDALEPELEVLEVFSPEEVNQQLAHIQAHSS